MPMRIGKCSFIAGIAALVLGLSEVVLADDLTAVPSLGNTVLDFDTGNGKFSAWQIHDLGAINSLHTTLQVHRLGDDPKWAPTFTITVANAGEKVIFQILSATRQPPLIMHLASYSGDKVAEDQNFTTTIGLDEKLDVSIDWTAAGIVTVRLGGGETRTLALKTPPTSLEITGSTGEVEFNPLRIGHAGP
jgi:hypothetical protein